MLHAIAQREMLLLVAKMYSRPLRVVSSMVTIKINPKNWHKDKIKMRAVGQTRILQERRGNCLIGNKWPEFVFFSDWKQNGDPFPILSVELCKCAGLVFSSNDHKRDDEMALEYGRQIGLDVVTRVLLWPSAQHWWLVLYCSRCATPAANSSSSWKVSNYHASPDDKCTAATIWSLAHFTRRSWLLNNVLNADARGTWPDEGQALAHRRRPWHRQCAAFAVRGAPGASGTHICTPHSSVLVACCACWSRCTLLLISETREKKVKQLMWVNHPCKTKRITWSFYSNRKRAGSPAAWGLWL